MHPSEQPREQPPENQLQPPAPPPPFGGAQPTGSAPFPGSAPPPGYGYYGPPRRTNSTAMAAMIVSLASLATCPLLGAVGIYLGNRAQREIAATGDDGEGMAKAGIIVGWIAIIFTVLLACFMAAGFGLALLPVFSI